MAQQERARGAWCWTPLIRRLSPPEHYKPSQVIVSPPATVPKPVITTPTGFVSLFVWEERKKAEK